MPLLPRCWPIVLALGPNLGRVPMVRQEATRDSRSTPHTERTSG